MHTEDLDVRMLIEQAMHAREQAYAPYSGYGVGAALLTEEEEVYLGCNVENISYGLTNCAERTAIFKAVSEGKRKFKAIAIVGAKIQEEVQADFSDYAYPCGACRQVLHEFCDQDFPVIVAKSQEDYLIYSLGELLPYAF